MLKLFIFDVLYSKNHSSFAQISHDKARSYRAYQNIRVTYNLKMLLAVTGIDDDIVDMDVRVFRRIICWAAIYR